MDSASISSEKYADLGGCYPPWPITMQLTWSEILRSYLASLDNFRMCFPNLVNRQLAMNNQSWDLSQSEKEKDLEQLEICLIFHRFHSSITKGSQPLDWLYFTTTCSRTSIISDSSRKWLTSGFLFNGVFTYCNLRRILLTCRHFKNGCLI